jgi:DNA-binding NarL/FixJ family response regulator
MVLTSAGYEVSTAEDGAGALFRLQTIRPDVIICELGIAQAPAGDFFALVRFRFPRVRVIGMSSSYGMDVPHGGFADAVYMKGQNGPEELLETVAALTEISAPWAIDFSQTSA